MTITIRSSGPGWTRVPHTLARDPRLTNGARGLAVQLLSHADGYRSDEEFLVGCAADSRNAVRKQLAELRQFGYLVRERVRGEDGKVTTRSVLYDVPQTPEPEDERPPSRHTSASRSDQGRFNGDGEAPANTPWRDGPSSGNGENSQVEPSRHQSAGRSEQDEQGITAGETDSPHAGAQSEDQREEIKEISQSARELAAVRHLAVTYGLTDTEATTAWVTAKARSPDKIHNPIPYLNRMAQRGDLADIVQAVQLAGRTPPPDPVPEPDDATPTPPPFNRPPPQPDPLHLATAPHCPHGQPNGATHDPAHGGPACGPCRLHIGACKTDPTSCPRCQEIAAAGWTRPPQPRQAHA